MTDELNVPDSDGKDDFTEGESPEKDPLKDIDLPEEQIKQHKNRNVRDRTMKPFGKTKVGRFAKKTLTGKNIPGKILFGALDVSFLPNIHEISKAVINDAEEQQRDISSTDIIRETAQRIDWARTGIGVGLVSLYLLDYISLEKAERAIQFISNFI